MSTVPKVFPLMLTRGNSNPNGHMTYLPWGFIAPYENGAQQNHRQSLERLAERGGLSPIEAHAILTGRDLRQSLRMDHMTEEQAHAIIDAAARAWVAEHP